MKLGEIGEVGEMAMSPGLADALQGDKQLSTDVHIAWQKYLQCDWGNLGEDDKEMNNNAVEDPGSDRILARYPTSQGDIYIITEQDRSFTLIMFCNEY